ncbi:MAG TPA: EscU/YscU/HrcU family type III secretion system export apparatus switch protein [Dongiaceae bacterium]
MAKDDEIGPKRQNWPVKDRGKPALAVALDYKGADGRPGARQAPRVAASGRGEIAEQIIALAFAKGIPVREDADLAEILSKVDVDSEIPIDALAAVAEILSYLYRYNRTAADNPSAGPSTGPTAAEAGAASGKTDASRRES